MTNYKEYLSSCSPIGKRRIFEVDKVEGSNPSMNIVLPSVG